MFYFNSRNERKRFERADVTETAQRTGPQWASYSDVERIYGISRTVAWRLLRDGKIRAARVGRSVRLDCQSIEDYLEQQAKHFEL